MQKIIDGFKKIPQGKLLHFIFGLMIAQVVAMFYVHCFDDHQIVGYINGFFVGSFCGFLKETIDKKTPGNKFDAEDWIATTLGSAIGIAILLIGYVK